MFDLHPTNDARDGIPRVATSANSGRDRQRPNTRGEVPGALIVDAELRRFGDLRENRVDGVGEFQLVTGLVDSTEPQENQAPVEMDPGQDRGADVLAARRLLELQKPVEDL